MKRAVLLLAVVALAGCAGNKPRPGQRPAASRPPAARPAPQTATSVPETSLSQAERYRQTHDDGPAETIDVSRIPEPVPRPEPLSRYGNRSPYNVLGRNYTVLPSARGYVERGISSWYGNKFHGYMTSSFEPYDMYQFSAAHKSLPLPSWARVTNLENGKSVIVRVNDRGPFHDNRLIDLSYAAAVKIGVWPKGTGLVEVRALMPGEAEPEVRTAAASPARTPPRPAPRPAAPLQNPAPAVAGTAASGDGAPDSAEQPRIYLQIGAFGEQANADRAAQRVAAAKLGEVRVVEASVNGRSVRRVRLGPLRDVDEADRLTEELRRLGLGEARVAID
ncbi:septal ring lytic transglycosylase RlpA family protein [Tahibacter harae]|uniref:Endolytic peptidoglycan transglycosylase RlpA n=1 Tax=Tahibacter harae TaxID=2963937 RepID=A0ABT1QWC2_9GAMM|nr:septal ring lytic transglycosylase RlpA family protein [Tahibacter harae]MCQ4166589.1 septal ring lytic transglycosylase RlpA family protein [Tahibacter harae]